MHVLKSSWLISCAVLVVLALGVNCSARTTWSGAASPDNSWTNDANWDNGAPGLGSYAYFTEAGSGNTDISLNGTVQPIYIIYFDTSSAASYKLGVLNSGDQFDFGSLGSVLVGAEVANSQTINAAITTSGRLHFGVSNSATTLTAAGVISGSGTLNVDNKGAITFGGQNTFTGGTEFDSALAPGFIRIRSDTIGGPGSISSGPFGTGLMSISTGSSPQNFQPIGADRTIANNWYWAAGGTGGITVSNNTTLDAVPRSLLLSGQISFAGNQTVTNNLPAGATLTVGSAENPSTIVRDKALTFQSQAGPGGGVLVVNSAITASGSPLTFRDGIQATLNSLVAGNGNLVASAAGTIVHLNKAGLYSGTGSVQTLTNATMHFDTADVLSGASSLLAQTGGTIYMPFANSGFTGATEIQGLSTDLAKGGGKLYVNNTTGSATGSGTVSVWTGTLGGNGIIGGTVNVLNSTNGASHLSPGNNAPGKLTVGTLNFSGTSNCLACNFDVEIGGTTPGAGYDQVIVVGNLAIGSAAATRGTLNVSLVNGFVRPASDTTFTILAAAARTGLGFTTVSLPNNDTINWGVQYTPTSVLVKLLGNGDFNSDGIVDAADYVVWRKTPANNGGAGGYDTWRRNVGNVIAGSGSGLAANSAVPEPALALLVIMGVAGVAAGRTRRRAAK